MSITSIFDFDSSASFALDQSIVQAGQGSLDHEDTESTWTEDFADDTGHTYDAAKAEFAGGQVQQKSQAFNPTFASVAGLVTGVGSLTKNTGNDLWGDAGAISSEQIASKGWIQFRPSQTDKAFLLGLSSSNASANYDDVEFGIYCGLDNTLRVFESGVDVGVFFGSYLTTDVFRVEAIGGAILYKKNGVTFYTSLITPSFPLFMDCSFYSNGGAADNIQMVSGFEYLASNVELPQNVHSVPGQDIASLTSFVVSESGAPRYIVKGKYWNGSAWVTSNNTYAQANSSSVVSANIASLGFLNGDNTIDLTVVFTDTDTQAAVANSAVGHLAGTHFETGSIETGSALSIQSITSFAASITEPANTTLRFQLRIDGTLKYWNGSAWVASDGSTAQGNTAAQINSNVGSLSLGQNSSVKIRIALATSDIEVSPSIEEMTIVYDFGGIGTEPITCIVWGYYRDISGQPVSGATVTFSLVKNARQYKEAASSVIEKSVAVTTDSNGYFETDLIRSSEFEGAGVYKITIVKESESLNTSQTSSATDLTFSVPDAVDKDITDLLTAA